MAVKSVIEIDVQDASFRTFAETYRKYQEQVSKAKGQWRDVNLEVKKAKTQFDQMVLDAIKQNEEAKLYARAQEVAAKATEFQAGQWRVMARGSREFASNITRATTALLRWSSITGVVSGLLGAGGLFGIERLAANVAGTRRNSQGLGSSYGDYKSFGVNFERTVDPGSFLSSVAEARTDIGSRRSFYGAGLKDSDLKGSTADIAVRLLPALKRFVDRTPDALLQSQLGAFGLDKFLGVQDALRLKSQSPAEIQAQISGYGKDRKTLSLAESSQRSWQDFTTQMDRAGQSIENIFVKKLTPLIPGFTQLSDSVVKAVESLLSSPKIGEWMKELGGGIEKFAKYVGTDEFQNKIRDFVKGVGEFSDSTLWLLKKLHFISSGVEAPTATHIGGVGTMFSIPAPGDDKGVLAGSSPELARRAALLKSLLPEYVAKELKFTSGHRSREDQERLYANRANNPYPVARPGTSEHERDLALDYSRNKVVDAYLEAHPEVLGKAGFERPYANDPIHLRMTGQKVSIEINNNTGGNANVTASQVAAGAPGGGG